MCLLALLAPEDAVNILALAHVHTATFDQARARTVRLDRPPFEKGDGAHATNNAARTITLDFLLGKTARVAASSALGVILLLYFARGEIQKSVSWFTEGSTLGADERLLIGSYLALSAQHEPVRASASVASRTGRPKEISMRVENRVSVRTKGRQEGRHIRQDKMDSRAAPTCETERGTSPLCW